VETQDNKLENPRVASSILALGTCIYFELTV